MINKAGRDVPEFVEHYGKTVPFQGAFQYMPAGLRYYNPPIKYSIPRTENRILDNLKDAFVKLGVTDGMTLSFHHGLRNGDQVLNLVIQAAAELGLKDLTVAASGIMASHAPLVKHLEAGVVSHIDTNGLIGDVADYIANGKMKTPVVIRSHGGRARAIECGQLHIDVAFVAVSCADHNCNLTGCIGPNAFGSLGYAIPDAQYADHVVGVTDTVSDTVLERASIRGDRVDYVVKVDCIGDTNGIATGSLALTKDPIQLNIAKTASKIADALGFIKNGYKFQTGGGGPSIAYAKYVKELLLERGESASFCMGGITGFMVDMMEAGVLDHVYDTQSFDLTAIRSIAENPKQHEEISCAYYASPFSTGCIVNHLDNCLLGAFEVDLEYNLNCLTGMDGISRTGIGGNPDTAAGSAVSIVTANLIRGRVPTVVDRVHTLCTPGETVDILVTDRGVAVNPLRQDIIDTLTEQGFKLNTIEELKALAESLVGVPEHIKTTDKIVAVIEYRDGTMLDTIKQVAP